MNYIISAGTDIGPVKDVNQDSLFVRVIRAGERRMVLAVICDGMGGLARGELASAALLRAFTDWMNRELPPLAGGYIDDGVIRAQWDEILSRQNEKIIEYGTAHGIQLGTTIVALLITDRRYYIANVGDCRAYEISDSLRQITRDQTVVAREVARGNMTQEEADDDPRRNVLLQCVGVSGEVVPDFFFGDTRRDAVYMLCSDGFRHELTPGEVSSAEEMKLCLERLIDTNKRRGERDNISVVAVRTF